MPNLGLFQVEAPLRPGMLRNRIQDLVVVLGSPVAQEWKETRISVGGKPDGMDTTILIERQQ